MYLPKGAKEPKKSKDLMAMGEIRMGGGVGDYAGLWKSNSGHFYEEKLALWVRDSP